jgi:hypothetical protein
MFRARPLHKLRGYIIPIGLGVGAALVLLAALPVRSAQEPSAHPDGEVLSPPAAVKDRAALTPPDQKGDPKESNLEKTKTEAAELSTLADQVRNELNKMTVDVFSLDIVEKTEKIEKLAKKIKDNANGYLRLNSQQRQGTP